MSNIKKFRIKSFKNNKAILKLDRVSLKYGRKTILDNLNLLANGEIKELMKITNFDQEEISKSILNRWIDVGSRDRCSIDSP